MSVQLGVRSNRNFIEFVSTESIETRKMVLVVAQTVMKFADNRLAVSTQYRSLSDRQMDKQTYRYEQILNICFRFQYAIIIADCASHVGRIPSVWAFLSDFGKKCQCLQQHASTQL